MALALLSLFTVGLGAAGVHLFEAGPPLQEHFLRRMVLPWFALAFLMMAAYTRLTRAAMLDVLDEDYVRTAARKRPAGAPRRPPARAAGRADPGRHPARHRPRRPDRLHDRHREGVRLQGVGQLVYQSIAVSDTPVIIGVTLLVTLSVTVANLLVDIGYAVLDPRVRLA